MPISSSCSFSFLRVAPLSSQNVLIHHSQTQEYVLRPKYFAAQKVMAGEQATEGAFAMRPGQEPVAVPFQCEYDPDVIVLGDDLFDWNGC